MIANIFYRSYANHLPPNNIIASLHKKKAHPEDVPASPLTTASKPYTKPECAMLQCMDTPICKFAVYFRQYLKS